MPTRVLAIKKNGPVENSTGPLFLSHAGKRRSQCSRSVHLERSSHYRPTLHRSMTEVTHTRQHHRNVVLISRADHFVVAHRAARLDHAGCARGHHDVETVTEREERIR